MARSPSRAGDATHVADCAHRALACAAQALFAVNRRCLINEKGALEEAARFPVAIPNLEQRLARAYSLKETADYAIGHDARVSAAEADRAIEIATRFVEAMSTHLSTKDAP